MKRDICLLLSIKTFLKHIIYSNAVISLSCGVLTWGFCEFTHLSSALLYGIFAFFGTFCIYNFQRLVKNKQHPTTSPHTQWVEKNLTGIYVCCIISLIGMVYAFSALIHWNPIIIGLCIFAALICVFYIVRIHGKNLREIPFIKIHLISSIWVFMISLFPLLNEQNLELNNWMFGVAHYAYFLAICIPFDIRDMAYDSAEQKTIPQILGVQSAKMIAMLLLVCFILVSMTFQERLATNNLFLIAVVFQLLLVYFTTKKSSDLYFGVLIDGAILLLGISYFI